MFDKGYKPEAYSLFMMCECCSKRDVHLFGMVIKKMDFDC